MARKRMIDPGIWTSEQVNNLSHDARLLFIGLISNADDEGRLKGSPRYLKAVIFPYDDIDTNSIKGWLDEISSQKLVYPYNVNGDDYIAIPNFLKHQTINRPTPSRLPVPNLNEPSVRTHGGLSEDSPLKEEKIKEEKIKEEEGGMGETDRDYLYKILEGTRGFPKYSQENIWKLEDVMKDYPGFHYLLEFKKFKEYWNTRKLKRPWLALRNWLGKVKEQSGKAKGRGLPNRKDYTEIEYPDD